MNRGDLIRVQFPGEGDAWTNGVYLDAAQDDGYHVVAVQECIYPPEWETYTVQTDRIRPAGSVGEA